MPTLPTPFAEIRRSVEVWHECVDEGFPLGDGTRGGERRALAEASSRMEIPGSTGVITKRLDTAVALGVEVRSWRVVEPEWAAAQVRRYRTYDTEFQDAESRLSRPGAARSGKARGKVASPPPGSGQTPDRASALLDGIERRTAEPNASADALLYRISPTVVVTPDVHELASKIVPLLRSKPLTIEEVAARLQVSELVAFRAIMMAHSKGASITERGDKWYLDTAPPTGTQRPVGRQLVTDSDGNLEFAGCADQHLCSKYERLDCLEDYYDQVQRRGISIVLNGGNWIDGESSFNRHDLSVHGMDQQMQYLARNYPKRDGIETWAITGEDHEGWYARREGVDVGRYAENVMRAANRTDWHDVGFMETFIPIVHGDTGKSSQLCLMHPGGGSAYAISYAPQKIVEGFDGGAKPAVLLIGHYHKSSYQMTRSVHTTQLGCFQDQSLFMRQKKLAAHLGGWFFRLHVDPETGAVDEFTGTFRNYFVKEFYAGRWSEHGPVNRVPRSPVPGTT